MQSAGDKVLYMDILNVATHLSDSEKRKLLSGDGFVQVPRQELSRLRVDVYPYLM